VFAVVVAIAGYLLAIQPQRTKLSAVEAQITSAQAQLVGLHATAGKKPHLQTAQLFQLSRAMPNADDMPGILLDLSQLASASHATLIAVSPQSRVALLDGSSAVPLRVTVDGTWTEITSFLRHVRNQVSVSGTRLSVAGRVFDVDNVQLTTQAKPQSPLEAFLTINAFDYGAPPSATATAGTQAATTTTSSSSSAQAAGAQGSGQ
jgi:Tfp pilus assembly protein PilO